MKILVLHEKHGDVYLGPFETDEEREALAAMIVNQRAVNFVYGVGDDFTKAADSIGTGTAWQYLQNHQAEYEDVEEATIRNIYYAS